MSVKTNDAALKIKFKKKMNLFWNIFRKLQIMKCLFMWWYVYRYECFVR